MADPAEQAGAVPPPEQPVDENIDREIWRRGIHALETFDQWRGHIPSYVPVAPRLLEALSYRFRAMGTGLIRRDLDDPDSGRLSFGETVGKMTELYAKEVANLGLAAIEIVGICYLIQGGRNLIRRGAAAAGEAGDAGPPDPLLFLPRPGETYPTDIPPLRPEPRAEKAPPQVVPEPEPADTREPGAHADPEDGAGPGGPGATERPRRIFGDLPEQGRRLWEWIDNDLLGETDEKAVEMLKIMWAAGGQLLLGNMSRDSRARIPTEAAVSLGNILIERKRPKKGSDIFDVAAGRIKKTWEGLSEAEQAEEIARMLAEAERLEQLRRRRQQNAG